MIDIRTFMLVLAIGNIGFAIVMAGYARHGADNPALRLWRWAKLVQGLAHLLGWLRPASAPLLLNLVFHSGLVLGVMLEAAAYCGFFAYARWRRLLYPACALALLLYHGARVGGAPAPYLGALLCAMFALPIGVIAAVLLGQQRASLLQRIVGANNLAFVLALAVCTWVILGNGALAGWSPAGLHGAIYMAGYLLMIVNSFGFLLLCKEKDDARMAQLATIDSLTGLWNRRAFFEHTERARMLALRHKQSVAMMMLDIDHFKRLNDRYGHAAGDEALCAFARTAQATLRDHDILGRVGGEEFALLLPATDVVGAMGAAERLRAAVEAAPVTLDGQTLVLTVSIGVVMVDAVEHINAAMARADHALYCAKSGGRNRVEVELIKRRASEE